MNQEGFFEGNEEGKDRQHEPQTMNDDDREKKKKIVALPDETTFLREAPTGKPLAATLKLLEERGALRTQETDHHDVVGDQEKGGSSLERRDEFGRIMTPKEAFRVDCHKFQSSVKKVFTEEGFSEGNEEGKDRQHEPQTMNDDREKKKKKIVAPPDETNFLREAPIGKGLAATLKLLEERGALRTQEIGRGVVGDQERVGSSIERRDEFGRIMTPKEAFRVDCHKFHGKGFGKRKQEKRRKRYLAELRSNQLLS